MATASTGSRRRLRRQESESTRPARRKSRGWLKWVVLGVTTVAVLVFIAPIIIAKTSLRNAPLRIALDGIDGTVQCTGASLSWVGPIRYSGIEVRDATGGLLLSLDEVETERSLLGILTDLSNLGTIRITRPEVSLTLRPDGSNANDVLGPWLEKLMAAPSSGSSPALTLEIVDGVIDVNDTVTNEVAKLDDLDFTLSLARDQSLPTSIALSGKAIHQQQTSTLSITSTQTTGGSLDGFDVKIQSLPLAILQPLVQRFATPMQLAGDFSTDLQCTGIGSLLDDSPENELKLTGAMVGQNIAMAGGPLGADRMTLARLDIPCRVTVRNRHLDVEQLAVTTEVGNLSVTGNAAMPENADAGMLAALMRSTFNVQGQVDLAKLAALLPNTLHVRPGTQVTAGTIQCALAAQPGQNGHTWSGQLVASGLTAIDQGRAIAWQQPIDLQFSARENGGVFAVDQLRCVSDFLNLTASGSLDQLQAQATVDLNRLTKELGQFVDLGQTQLAGQGTANLHWNWTAATGQCEGSSAFQFQSLQITLPGQATWQEDSIVGAASFTATSEPTTDHLTVPQLRTIDSAQVNATVTSGAAREMLDIRLTAPVKLDDANVRWPVDASVQAQLAKWWPRIGAWMEMGDLALGGACSLAAKGAYSAAGIEIQQASANINQLHAWGWDTFFIDEPVVKCNLAGNYDFATGRLQLQKTTLLTSTISLQTEGATVVLGGNEPFNAQGNVAYQADLARLTRWITNPRTPPSYNFAGRMIGNAEFAHATTTTSGAINAGIENFAVYVVESPATRTRIPAPGNAAPVAEPVWTERNLTISAQGGLDSATDAVRLTSLNVGSKALQMEAAGKIEQFTTRKNVNLTGKVTYDWRTLSPLLRPYLGQKINISGTRTDNFALRGPLGETDGSTAGPMVQLTSAAPLPADDYAFLKPMVGNVAFGWSSANVYGLPIGPLNVEANLRNGRISTNSIEAKVGQAPGKLTLSPIVRLSPGPAELVLNQGPLVSNVQISQEQSNLWLKYVVPWVAAATRTEGTFSINLDRARIPLDAPERSSIYGTLVIHKMEVTAGPMVRPLALIGKQVEAIIKDRAPPLELDNNPTLIRFDPQEVKFRMADGRIYDEGLTMRIGNTPVRTYGWVSLDERINLTAEVTLKNGRVVKIPIEGTLGGIKLDPRTLLQMVPNLLENATRGLEGELNKQLERIFPGQR